SATSQQHIMIKNPSAQNLCIFKFRVFTKGFELLNPIYSVELFNCIVVTYLDGWQTYAGTT
ncbi:MAG: hypothetical protein ACR2MX_08185, partial [Cyclobacteriaceae bacterium]